MNASSRLALRRDSSRTPTPARNAVSPTRSVSDVATARPSSPSRTTARPCETRAVSSAATSVVRTRTSIRFEVDEVHRAYDAEFASRFFRVLVQADRVFKTFRARFTGKCSPVHFFWGAPDLAVTRFSGRRAPQHPGGVPHLPDAVAREAYSHEVSSCGFWPGGGAVPYAAFYSYAYPEPQGFAAAQVTPAGAFYSNDLREFILPYDVVRAASDPDETLLAFLQSTYEAAADLANWYRSALEWQGAPGGKSF